jgi:ubiquinone/menaquinone biosynthesis C-methylase UbiE
MKITRPVKESVRKVIPTEYSRYAGIEPYFVPLFGRIYWQRLEKILGFAEREIPKNGAYIADLGSGFGVLVALLAKTFCVPVVGIDRYPAGPLHVAQDICNTLSSNQCSFVRGDISRLAFQSDVFHACFCLDVLEHVPKVGDCFEEIRRVLKKDGSLFVTVPVESKMLNIAREVTSLHGRRRETSPHWHGTIAGCKEFEARLSDYFSIIRKEYIPNKLLAYDVAFVCRKQ